MFHSLGPSGTWINIYEKFTETFFTANIRWFLGNDAHDEIKNIKGYLDVDTGEAKDVTFH